MKPWRVSVFAILLSATFVTAQEQLTNESIVKMVKAGLGEGTIITMIDTQPGKYSLGANDVIEMKRAGVAENIISAMLKRSAGPDSSVQPLTPRGPSSPASAGPLNEVGVYFSKGGSWQEIEPEIVNWKTGGVLKHVGTAGVVKGDVNGHINGTHSRTELKLPLKFMIYVPEGVSLTEYQLLHLRVQKGSREFRTVTGGIFHVSGGATRDLVEFESKKVSNRTYLVSLPNFEVGDYGFLPPGAVLSSHASATIGKMYTFRVLEGD